MHFKRVFTRFGEIRPPNVKGSAGIHLCRARGLGLNTPVRVPESQASALQAMLARVAFGLALIRSRLKANPIACSRSEIFIRLYQMLADIRIEALAHAITPLTRGTTPVFVPGKQRASLMLSRTRS